MLRLRFKQITVSNVWDYISKYCLYAAIALTPFIFLPWTLYPLTLNKQFLLTSLVFLAFVSWLIKGVSKGELTYAKSPINVLLFMMVVLTAVSNWFSKSRTVGFMGVEGGEVNIFINIITFGFLYFLLASLMRKEKDMNLVFYIFLLSSFLVLLVSLLQFLGLWIWPWDFAQNTSFNPIGTTNALGIYLGFVLVTTLSLIYQGSLESTFIKALLGVFSALLFITVFLIGYWPVFLGLILSLLILVIVKFYSKDNDDVTKASLLPLSIITFSVFVLLVNFGIIEFKLPVFNVPVEVTPSLGASWDIVKSTTREGIKNFVLGSGPGTFPYQYGLYKDASLNDTAFWNLRFAQGYNAFIGHLTELGFLGILFFIAILGTILFYAFKLFPYKKDQWNSAPVLLGIKMGLIYLIFLLFFYPQNYVIYFSIFVFAGILLANHSLASDNYRTLSLIGSPFKTLSFSLGSIILIIIVTSLLYVNGQRYLGSLYFSRGVNVINSTGNIDNALKYFLVGLDMDSRNDFYLQTISTTFLMKVEDVLSKPDLSQEDLQAQLSGNIGAAIQMARRSTEVNPGNSSNWLGLARVYENIILLVTGAAKEAFVAYGNAIKLEPNNPLFYSGLGRAHLAFTNRLSQELAIVNAGDSAKIKELKESRENSFSLAIANFDKALSLKPDYAPAHFSLVQVFDRQGKTEEAIARAERLRSVVLSDNDPANDLGILFQLGLLHYQANRFNKAKDLLKNVVQISPDYSNALYFLGIIYDRQGESVKALELFRKIAKLNPDNSEVRKIINNLIKKKPALSDIDGVDIQERREAPIEDAQEKVLLPKIDS